jgi:cbb3-type cytochrome oxidase subunit 1
VETFVKNFIVMSIVYLAVASIIGIMMFADSSYLTLKFAHSHLMLLGWVSMMIYGVGYHILPRFVGKFLKSRSMGITQFWLANLGLVGMVVFSPLMQYNPANGLYRILAVVSGIVEAVSILLFFYNMMATLLGKAAE